MILRAWRAVAAAAALTALASCATSAPTDSPTDSRILVVASVNAWGSILSQLGGDRVRTVSIISNPSTDPHDYEPIPADARLIARSAVFVQNGVGYDAWADKVLQASPNSHRQLVDVGALTATPATGNPHLWYSPDAVTTAVAAITSALVAADPADAGYFRSRRTDFENSALRQYHQLIAQLRSRYAGTPVGASESIFVPMAAALGLNVITPPTFLRAVSEGSEPSAADKAAIDSDIAAKKLRVYVENSQNATPDIAAQVSEARRAGIPISTVTETLTPATSTFQQWQVDQLERLRSALAEATGG